MLMNARALVVSDDPSRIERWSAWLEHAGYATFSCQGPGIALGCPRTYGQRCVRREMVDVAVVDLGCDDLVSCCTKVPDDHGTVFVGDAAPATGSPVDDPVELIGAVDLALTRVAG
ncbi:MAG: hypothetical protein HY240_04285 [Actinobacteria bacterium]|nr:hypothetical protein [Actinomycetota bacterium]